MAVQIVDRKQAEREARHQVLMLELAAASVHLLTLKDIKTKIERGKATPAEKRAYTRGKDKAWKRLRVAVKPLRLFP